MQSNPEPITACPSDHAMRTMFEARKRVFVDLLGWDVPVLEEKYEIDQFDTADAAYLILSEISGEHRASARLLRSDGPHILQDLFSFLVAGPVPTGPDCREITRFCIDPLLDQKERRLARDQLVSALADYAMEHGVCTYTAVAGESWFAQIAAFGWHCSRLGETHSFRGEKLVALRIDIDADTRQDLERGGIYCANSYRMLSCEEEIA